MEGLWEHSPVGRGVECQEEAAIPGTGQLHSFKVW